MTNHLKLVVDQLKKENQEDKRLDNCDAAYVCNKYLLNNRQRQAMAIKLGFDDRCCMCKLECKYGSVGNYSPMCRSGLIAWLEEDDERH